MHLIIQRLIILLISYLLIGCAQSVNDLHNGNSKTLEQVVSPAPHVNHQIPMWADSSLRGFSRNQANELDNEFQLFPNPTIYIYIDPHITDDGLPLMGMTTKTRMFHKDHYAHPYEVMALGGANSYKKRTLQQ